MFLSKLTRTKKEIKQIIFLKQLMLLAPEVMLSQYDKLDTSQSLNYFLHSLVRTIVCL